jgi:ABC-type Fe3+ transport system substrate-binding protein
MFGDDSACTVGTTEKSWTRNFDIYPDHNLHNPLEVPTTFENLGDPRNLPKPIFNLTVLTV